MTITLKNNQTTKTTINLNTILIEKIRELSQKHIIKNQTDFINTSLENSIISLEKEMNLRKLKDKIHSIQRINSNTSIVETLQEIRQSN